MSSKNKAKAEKPELEQAEDAAIETVAEAEPAEEAPLAEETADQEEVSKLSDLAFLGHVHGDESPLKDLHGRLTKAVQAISATGGQEKVFALHQLEILTGRLKFSIVAGIAATDDKDLKAGLEALLLIL